MLVLSRVSGVGGHKSSLSKFPEGRTVRGGRKQRQRSKAGVRWSPAPDRRKRLLNRCGAFIYKLAISHPCAGLAHFLSLCSLDWNTCSPPPLHAEDTSQVLLPLGALLFRHFQVYVWPITSSADPNTQVSISCTYWMRNCAQNTNQGLQLHVSLQNSNVSETGYVFLI